MKVTALFVKPEEYELELTIRMPVKEWQAIADALPQAYPCGRLQQQVTDVLCKVTRQFWADADSK